MYLISFGFGLERMTISSVEQSSALLSLNVSSASDEQQPITHTALNKIKKIDKIKDIFPQFTVVGEFTLEKKGGATVVGADPGFLEAGDTTKLLNGRYYQSDDQQSMVVTNGFLTLFGLQGSKTPLVTFDLQLDPKVYPNVPILKNISITGVVNSTAVIAYLPRAYLENVVQDPNLHYQSMIIKVASQDDIESVKNNLIKNGYKVSTVVDTVQDIRKIFFWIRVVMASLGLIAIFVASIGMFNTLTISLLERTREIGIMKAMGVKKVDIGRLFLTESLLMGLVGGVMGVLLAFFFQQITLFVLSILASVFAGAVPEIFYNNGYIVGGFILFALFIALATGLYPARRATHINAIDAIRYE